MNKIYLVLEIDIHDQVLLKKIDNFNRCIFTLSRLGFFLYAKIFPVDKVPLVCPRGIT